MKIIFHMGTPKIGSTSLFYGLVKVRNDLIDHGYFVSDGFESELSLRRLAAAFFEDFKVLPPFIRKKYETLENALAHAKYLLSEAAGQAQANSCHTLILVSELCFPHKKKIHENCTGTLAKSRRILNP